MPYLVDAGELVWTQGKDPRDSALLALFDLGPRVRFPLVVYDESGAMVGIFDREELAA